MKGPLNGQVYVWLHVFACAARHLSFTRCAEELHVTSADLQVLEIGCGTGILSFLLAPHVQRVVAVDAAESMIGVLQDKLRRPGAPNNILPLALLLEDPEDPALPVGEPERAARQKFDLITSHLVLHHIPDLDSVLRTMLGCLAPGGRVMLTDFEDFGPQAKRFHPAKKMAGVARHGIHAARMAAMMEEIGFRNVVVKPEWTMPKQVEREGGGSGTSSTLAEDDGEIMEFPFLLCYGER